MRNLSLSLPGTLRCGDRLSASAAVPACESRAPRPSRAPHRFSGEPDPARCSTPPCSIDDQRGVNLADRHVEQRLRVGGMLRYCVACSCRYLSPWLSSSWSSTLLEGPGVQFRGPAGRKQPESAASGYELRPLTKSVRC